MWSLEQRRLDAGEGKKLARERNHEKDGVAAFCRFARCLEPDDFGGPDQDLARGSELDPQRLK